MEFINTLYIYIYLYLFGTECANGFVELNATERNVEAQIVGPQIFEISVYIYKYIHIYINIYTRMQVLNLYISIYVCVCIYVCIFYNGKLLPILLDKCSAQRCTRVDSR